MRCMIAHRLTLTALLGLAPCAAGMAGPSSPATARDAAPAVVELSAMEARARMEAGTLGSRALTAAYLARIAALDDAGPRLGAVIELNPAAEEDAARLDAERAAGKVRGPVHGLPVLIKDNIDVAGMVNSAGSLALADNRPQRDAFVVARLRAAGAVILGKTNLSEWANFRSSRSISGWSSRGGQTRNPYVLDRNPCGSSSGTGTAIAASLAAIGIGTETDGSIICPSAVAGLVGIKPTVGLVSRRGIIPISATQDTAGPMARTVADAALLLGAMAGADPADPAGAVARGHVEADYTVFLRADALVGRRLGVLRQAMGFHPGVDALVERTMARLRGAGAELVEVTIPGYGSWEEAENTLLYYEFKHGLNAYLAAADAPVGSLRALIAWNEAHAAAAMPHFGQELFLEAQAKGPLSEPAYRAVCDSARRLALTEGLLVALDGQRLDALLAPSTGPAWLTDPLLGDYSEGSGYGMAAVAGTPSLTVPIGELSGLPIGLTIMGRAWSEGELIGLGYALEQLVNARRGPRYLPTLGDFVHRAIAEPGATGQRQGRSAALPQMLEPAGALPSP
jgi:amidase